MIGEQFDTALTKARRGEQVVYHVGLLMLDRLYNPDTDSVARAARRAYEEGKARLVQRRVSPTKCQYIAIKV